MLMITTKCLHAVIFKGVDLGLLLIGSWVQLVLLLVRHLYRPLGAHNDLPKQASPVFHHRRAAGPNLSIGKRIFVSCLNPITHAQEPSSSKRNYLENLES